jgi:DNA N-6-adenine-methyltransferase (Dam)
VAVMPSQRPGRSVQEVGTPDDFLSAFETRFGSIVWDLAANSKNSVLGRGHYGPGSEFGEDSLDKDWSTLNGELWLNPPFEDIGPWARKATQGGNVNLFVPLSSSNWARDYCWGVGKIYVLNPRITFKGHKTAYPKDMMLVRYGLAITPTVELWRWK